MILKVGKHRVEIVRDLINEKEINVTKCEFVFDEDITSEFVKEAYFTFKGTTYKQIIVNNQCDIPYEVLGEKGEVELGVVAYLVTNSQEIIRYNPTPVYFTTLMGSLKEDVENTEPITPSEMEQYEQALQGGLTELNDALDDLQDKVDSNYFKGDKGDKGDTGERGPIGPIGPQGPQGERGLTGETGPKGDVGPKGDTGATGASGRDATINGVNTLALTAGDNITLRQSGNTLEISATGGGSGGTTNYNDLSNKPKINNVELTGNKTANDLGLFSGNYNDLINKPTIPTVPTNVSAFTNDAGYLTQHQDLSNYATIQYVNNIVGNIETELEGI